MYSSEVMRERDQLVNIWPGVSITKRMPLSNVKSMTDCVLGGGCLGKKLGKENRMKSLGWGEMCGWVLE